MPAADAEVRARFDTPVRLDLGRTLRNWRMGPSDPTAVVHRRQAWRATRGPDGPVTVYVCKSPEDTAVQAAAWGPGAEWIVRQVPRLVGMQDDPESFVTQDRRIARLHRDQAGFRLGIAPSVLEGLVRVILEQRVTFADAARSYARLARAHAEPAPGPVRLLLPPDPARLAELPYYAYHPHGIEQRRAETIRAVCALDRRGPTRRVEALIERPFAEARKWLLAIPGVGPWTAGCVCGAALGDSDATVPGDLHLPHLVCWALGGEPRGTDARMLELLAPFAGHRYRVVRLLLRAGIKVPR